MLAKINARLKTLQKSAFSYIVLAKTDVSSKVEGLYQIPE